MRGEEGMRRGGVSGNCRQTRVEAARKGSAGVAGALRPGPPTPGAAGTRRSSARAAGQGVPPTPGTAGTRRSSARGALPPPSQRCRAWPGGGRGTAAEPPLRCSFTEFGDKQRSPSPPITTQVPSEGSALGDLLQRRDLRANLIN